MPTEATDRAFGHLKGHRRIARLRYRLGLWRLARRGVTEWKTVALLTRWYAGSNAPALGPAPLVTDRGSPVRREFDKSLSDLQTWIQGYAFMAGRIYIGPLALQDLPGLIPWVWTLRETPTAEVITRAGMLAIHGRTPHLRPAEGNQEAATAAAVVMRTGFGQFPLQHGLSLIFQGQAHYYAGRTRQAVIDVGTAVESIVATLLRRIWTDSGIGENEAENRLARARWTELYNRVLLDALEVPAGEGGKSHSDWWSHAYQLRTEVVHRAAEVHMEAAGLAVELSWELVDWLRRCTERIGRSDLSSELRFERQYRP